MFDGGGYIISNLKVDRGSIEYAGLFGCAESAEIKNVGLENVNVKGGERVGGLVGGQFAGSKVSNSYVTGDVTGSTKVGGLVGFQWGIAEIADSYTMVRVTGTYEFESSRYYGGLLGDQG